MCIVERIRRELMVQLSMLNKGRGRREGDVFRSEHQKGTVWHTCNWCILGQKNLDDAETSAFKYSIFFNDKVI
jgi:hypothetical protein